MVDFHRAQLDFMKHFPENGAEYLKTYILTLRGPAIDIPKVLKRTKKDTLKFTVLLYFYERYMLYYDM